METKERIMSVAFELFCSKGYDKVSMNEIVERSGVSKGGIFHHFESKYVLGRETLMWWAQTHMAPMFDEAALNEMSGKDILMHFIDFMMDFMENDNSFTKFFWSIFDEALRKKEDNTVWMDFLNDYVAIVEGIYMEMGVKDPRMKAMLFLSNMDGIALYYTMLKGMGMELDMKALRDEFVRTYVTFDEDVKE